MKSPASENIVIRSREAIRITREAGKMALDYFRTAGSEALAVELKGIQDFVTAADRAVEEYIRTALSDAFPQDGFLGEESGGQEGATGVWVVDPIDGTTNFMRGIDHWVISMAYHLDASARLGLIYDPVRDALYTARLGQGAWCNDKPLKVSEQGNPGQSLVLLGHSSRRPLDYHLAAVCYLQDLHIEYRDLGSAALALAWAAEGKVEGYFESHLNSWDALAGLLIAAEAGCRCAPKPGSDFLTEGGPVLVCSPALWPSLNPLLENL